MRNRWFKALFFVTVLGFLLIGCQKKVDFSPRPLNLDRAVCYVCKMGITDQRFAVQAISPQGDVFWFDDIGCLVEFMNYPEWKDKQMDKGMIWIGDMNTGKWIDARKAKYVFGIETPMGYGYGAVADTTGVDTVYTFQQVVERIRAGKTMREEFLKKMKGKMKHEHPAEHPQEMK